MCLPPAGGAATRRGEEAFPPAGAKGPKAGKRSCCRPGDESDSDFESDPPSPKSSEDEEQEEEVLNSEQSEDTEPENLGQRPLLMDSEEEDKRSSDSESEPPRPKSQSKKPAGSEGGAFAPSTSHPPEAVDVFGAVPFVGASSPVGASQSPGVFASAPFRQEEEEEEPAAEELDVFIKAPFSRNPSKTGRSSNEGQTPPLSPDSFDVFGLSPFQPGPAGPPPSTSRSAENVCPPQQRLKPHGLQKLSSRHRKTKQEAAGGGGKRHHGTPTGGRKNSKPLYRTPEKVRRHKKGGRRDSQSSNEFLSASDSKENISVDVPMADGRDRDDMPLDPFGARPFHPQDGGRHGQYPCLSEGQSDVGGANGKAWDGGRSMDDFGAVPFTDMVIGGPQQGPPQDLDPFGAAPFPSKH